MEPKRRLFICWSESASAPFDAMLLKLLRDQIEGITGTWEPVTFCVDQNASLVTVRNLLKQHGADDRDGLLLLAGASVVTTPGVFTLGLPLLNLPAALGVIPDYTLPEECATDVLHSAATSGAYELLPMSQPCLGSFNGMLRAPFCIKNFLCTVLTLEKLLDSPSAGAEKYLLIGEGVIGLGADAANQKTKSWLPLRHHDPLSDFRLIATIEWPAQKSLCRALEDREKA